MNSIENRLAAIGFCPVWPSAESWRVERIGSPRPLPTAFRSARTGRRPLAVWLDRLNDRRQPGPYRISPAGENQSADRG
jgi:hypothetical protein